MTVHGQFLQKRMRELFAEYVYWVDKDSPEETAAARQKFLAAKQEYEAEIPDDEPQGKP